MVWTELELTRSEVLTLSICRQRIFGESNTIKTMSSVLSDSVVYDVSERSKGVRKFSRTSR